MATTTASEAPASTPRMPGSARGLRVTPCIRPPARPSAMPTPSPSSVRGTRRLRTIRCSLEPSASTSASQTVSSEIGFDPNAIEHTTTTASAATATSRPPARVHPLSSSARRAGRRRAGRSGLGAREASRGTSRTAVISRLLPAPVSSSLLGWPNTWRWVKLTSVKPLTPDRRRRRRALSSVWSPRRARMTTVQSTGAIAPEGVTSDDVGVVAGVLVSVSPRRRVRSQADAVRLIIALALIGVGVIVATWLRNTIGGAEEDLVDVYGQVPDRFAATLTGVAVIAVVVVPLLALVVLIARRRFVQAGTLLSGAVVAGLAMAWLTDFLASQGVIAGVDPDTDRVVELTSPTFATSPLIAAAVALVIIASPWLSHQWRRGLWGGVGLLVLFRVVSSSEPPLDIVVAIAVGMAVGSLALLVFGTEGSDPEAPELVSMLRSVGRPRRIEQRAGNSPLVYDVQMAGSPPLEMRVRTAHDRSENMLEQLWRSVRLRTWITDQPYDTVQRRIEHEALAQRSAGGARAPAAALRGVVASPHGSVALLEDRVEGSPVAALVPPPASNGVEEAGPPTPAPESTPLATPETLDRAFVLDVWRQVQALHADRIAHRNLDLESVWMTPEGTAVLRGFDGAAIAASDRDLALDRAQLLVSTALVIGAQAAVDVACEALGAHALVTAVPYLQPLALPGATRRAWRANKDVLDGLRMAISRATGVEPAPLARLDRIRPRTAMSLAAVVVAFYVLLPQFGDFDKTVDAASEANWWWLVPMALGAVATMAAAAVAFVASVPEPIPYLPALRMQVASSFVSRLAPANTGTLAVGVPFPQPSGLPPR